MLLNEVKAQRTLLWLQVWAILAIALHIAAYVLPEEMVWGVWPYTVFPAALGVTLALVVGSTVIPIWNRKLQQVIVYLWAMLPAKRHRRLWFAALALATMPLFWWLRIRHLNWGDARVLVSGLSQRDAPVLYNWQAPLTVFLHQRLWALVVNPLWGWNVQTVYASVSVLCGGVFVYVVLMLAYELGQTTLERVLLTGMVFTGGAMQLFFGYVENYTIISLGIVIFLWLGLRVVRGQAPLWSATLALSLTNAFHPSTIVLWPAALYLAWRRYRADDTLFAVLQSLALPPLVVGSSVLTLMELGNHGLAAFLGDDRPGGGDHIWLVPLRLQIATEWQRYSMFSGAHLLDWGNEMVLTSVFGGVTVLVVGWMLWRARGELRLDDTWRDSVWFLGHASFWYLLLTWVWNADYGIRKDWDLFSPVSWGVNVLAGVLLVRWLRRDPDALGQATILILLVGGVHTAAWVLSNAFGVG